MGHPDLTSMGHPDLAARTHHTPMPTHGSPDEHLPHTHARSGQPPRDMRTHLCCARGLGLCGRRWWRSYCCGRCPPAHSAACAWGPAADDDGAGRRAGPPPAAAAAPLPPAAAGPLPRRASRCRCSVYQLRRAGSVRWRFWGRLRGRHARPCMRGRWGWGYGTRSGRPCQALATHAADRARSLAHSGATKGVRPCCSTACVLEPAAGVVVAQGGRAVATPTTWACSEHGQLQWCRRAGMRKHAPFTGTHTHTQARCLRIEQASKLRRASRHLEGRRGEADAPPLPPWKYRVAPGGLHRAGAPLPQPLQARTHARTAHTHART